MQTLLVIAGLFVLISILLVLYVIWKQSRRKIPEKHIQKIQKTWKEIIRQKDYKHAIMDADKLLDHALYLSGYKGSLGAKLKKAGPIFKNINKVWSAHKVRNNIAHQINYKVNEKTYRTAMLNFKQAFKDLKIF